MTEKREELLTRMIRIKYAENPKFDEGLLEAVVECHEQNPYWWEED